MKRISSLLLFSLFALIPVLQVSNANAMWRPKKDSIGRSLALPWIRALKVPLATIGALASAWLVTKAANIDLSESVEASGISATGALKALVLLYVMGASWSAFAHPETPYQQTQELTERLSDTVYDATIQPAVDASHPDISVKAVAVALPAAVLLSLFCGKEIIVENLTIDNAKKFGTFLVGMFGFSSAIQYMRRITNFATNKPQ